MISIVLFKLFFTMSFEFLIVSSIVLSILFATAGAPGGRQFEDFAHCGNSLRRRTYIFFFLNLITNKYKSMS